MKTLSYVAVFMLTFVVFYFSSLFVIPYYAQDLVLERIDQMSMQRTGEALSYNHLTTRPLRDAPDDVVPGDNPDTLTSFSMLDLSDGPVRFVGSIPDARVYWSLSLYADNTDNFFVLNDRAIEGSSPVVVIRTAGQDYRPRENEIEVVSPSPKAVLLVRLILRDRHDQEEVAGSLATLREAYIEGVDDTRTGNRKSAPVSAAISVNDTCPAARHRTPDEAFSPACLVESVEQYVGFGSHRTGSEGEAATAGWLENSLIEAGFEVYRQDIEYSQYIPETEQLVSGDTAVNGLSLWPPVWTAASGLQARLKHFRPYESASLEGEIALLDLPFRRHNSVHEVGIDEMLAAAEAAGASAVVAVTHGPSGDLIALNSRTDRFRTRVPVMLISPGQAEQLRPATADGREVTLRLTGSGPTEGLAQNIVGKIDRGGPWLVVSTPFSGWYGCAAERGPGLAIFLALAHWLPKAFPQQSMMFVANTGHELGNLGAHAFLHELAPAPVETRLWLHLGAGLAARDFHEIGTLLLPLPSADSQRYLGGNGDTQALLKKTFKGLNGLEQAYSVTIEMSAGELKNILAAGYSPAIGAFGSHRFHHSVNDTLDKTDGDLLAPVAAAFRQAVSEFLNPAGTAEEP
jgi:uncharacterized membrane protein